MITSAGISTGLACEWLVRKKPRFTRSPTDAFGGGWERDEL